MHEVVVGGDSDATVSNRQFYLVVQCVINTAIRPSGVSAPQSYQFSYHLVWMSDYTRVFTLARDKERKFALLLPRQPYLHQISCLYLVCHCFADRQLIAGGAIPERTARNLIFPLQWETKWVRLWREKRGRATQ
jgi:hypothetical protein